MAEHNIYGEWGEDVAVDYLSRHDYAILDRNWRSRSGYELDIVALHKNTIVVVEVKTRADEHFLPALHAITREKIQHIRRAATSYLRFRHLTHLPTRYDVITIVGHEPDYRLTHIEGAFK